MLRRRHSTVFLAALLAATVGLSGCVVYLGGCNLSAKFERQVQLTDSLTPGASLAARTHNGEISVRGADITTCELTATIIARATTDEAAEELAHEVQVRLQREGDDLVVKIDKPQPLINRSVTVNLDITVPHPTDLNLTTHNGAVTIEAIEAQVKVETHNGSITTQHVAGPIELRTYNGGVRCEQITGNTEAHTHNGSIRALYADAGPPGPDITLTTHNGGITLETPPDYSAIVDAGTYNGSVRTELPIAVVGKVSKKRLQGKIGDGQATLRLETHNGSITIR